MQAGQGCAALIGLAIYVFGAWLALTWAQPLTDPGWWVTCQRGAFVLGVGLVGVTLHAIRHDPGPVG